MNVRFIKELKGLLERYNLDRFSGYDSLSLSRYLTESIYNLHSLDTRHQSYDRLYTFTHKDTNKDKEVSK